MILKIKKLHKDAKMPSYAHHDDAGFDLFSLENCKVRVGERVAVPTGIAMEIPEGFVGPVWDKSGIAMKHGLKTIAGVVDSTYRGEMLVCLINLGDKDYTFEKGHPTAISSRSHSVSQAAEADAHSTESGGSDAAHRFRAEPDAPHHADDAVCNRPATR